MFMRNKKTKKIVYSLSILLFAIISIIGSMKFLDYQQKENLKRAAITAAQQFLNDNVIDTSEGVTTSTELLSEIGYLKDFSDKYLSNSYVVTQNDESEAYLVANKIQNNSVIIDAIVAESTKSPSKKTNGNVLVTVEVNKPIDTSKISGWSFTDDNKKLTKIFTENAIEKIKLVSEEDDMDFLEYTIKVENIDRIAPTLNVGYDITANTNKDVQVTIVSNEEINEVEGWTLSADKLSMTKTYSANIEENVVIKDIAGNEATAVIDIKNIDKTAPVVNNVNYSETNPTNEDVQVSIVSNEALQELVGWTLSSDKLTLSRTYATNIDQTIVIKDLVGNTTNVGIKISNIDKDAPSVVLNYSPKKATNGNVIVQIGSNEAMQELTGWVLAEDKLSMTKTYSENKTEIVVVRDLLGNSVEQTIAVNNIDKNKPSTSFQMETEANSNNLYNTDVVLKIIGSDNENVITSIKYLIVKNNVESEWIERLGTDSIITLSEEGNYSVKAISQDAAGNWSDESVSTSIIIDKTKANVTVNYSKTEITNEDILVTLTSNEELRELTGWTLAVDKLSMSKMYTENTTENITVSDLTGNETVVNISITNVDKVKAVVTATYSNTNPTNKTVKVTLSSDKVLQKLEDWTLSKDKLSMSKTYSVSVNENVTVKDIAGNETVVNVVITNIDKEFNIPTISYDKTEITNGDVIATITSDEAIQEVEGWTLSADKLSMSKMYTENTTEKVTLKDLAGNAKSVTVKIKNIDKTKAEVTATYSNTNPTNKTVKVTLSSNEAMQELIGWTLSGSKKVLTKVYSDNVNENVIVKDRAGNETTINVVITNIDKEFNIPTISYDKTEITNGNVIATITADEAMQETAGWTIAEDKLSMSKTYAENTTEKVTLRDLAGNAKSVTVKIKNIDKTSAELTTVYSNINPTNKTVKVTLSSNEAMQELIGWTLSGSKKVLTKVYSDNVNENVIVKDIAGNETIVNVTITNIDKEFNLPTVSYDKTEITNGDVIATITADEAMQELAGWTIAEDKLSMSKTYAENTTEKVTLRDLAGNAKSVTVKIKNIDKTSAELTTVYSNINPTNKTVKVTLSSNEAMQELIGWTLSGSKKVLTKVYSDNVNENVIVKDIAGNETIVNVTITNIDKEFNLPTVSYDKTEITNGDVIATITADEAMQELAGWVLAEDKLSMSKTYTENTTEKVTLRDLAGNAKSVTVKIKNIDKEFNLPIVSYSTTLLTNGDVIATITADEAMQELIGWVLSVNKLSMTKTYADNVNENVSVKDIAGNEATINVVITNIDKEFNLPTVSYDTTLPTNGNVVVTITADEKMKNLGDWELSSDRLSMTKEYEGNINEDITVEDLAGNAKSVTVKITNIDKEFNLPIVSYDKTEITNGNVIATITADEAMQELAGWELSNDKLSMSKMYTSNINEDITVNDLVGNSKTVNVVITNIDKEFNLPVVSYDKTEITNGDVIATITADEAMQELAGWELSNDKLSMSKMYTSNINEDITVNDLAGNTQTINVTIVNIDKEFNLPTVSYDKTEITNGNVIATITADEAMQELAGWELSNDKLSMTKTYADNVNENVSVKDIAGNEATINVVITNIDKEFNLPTVSYDITLPTNGNVIVTITADEQMKNLSGWELSSDRLSMTKEYEGNINEDITVEDLAGNTKTVNVTISNIDKEFNLPIISYSTTLLTNGDVIANITADEAMQELTGWVLAEDKLSMTKTYIGNINENVIVNDLVGNAQTVNIVITNIDKEFNLPVVSYDTILPTNGNVVVTITADEKMKNLGDWELSSDRLSMSKMYTSNINEDITVEDLAGNTRTVNVTITNIDKEFNLPVVSYDKTEITNGDVIATITADEAMQELTGWELSNDKLSMSKMYTSNINEDITVNDLVGNTKTVNVTITNIDKEFNLPVVSYDKTEITNGDVIATITADEAMQEVAGWTIAEDKLSMSKTYATNVTENVLVKDIAGNEVSVSITIANIDKEFNLPTVSYDKTEITNGDVIATITADEAMQELTGWELSNDKLSMSKTYTVNATENVTIKDIAGNEVSINITIANIDKEFNLPVVSYDITSPTNGNVVVTITADEVMQELTDWTLAADKLSMSRTYTANVIENVIVKDIAGNETSINITIANIDKEFNLPIVNYSTTLLTNGDVIANITADEAMQEVAGWVLSNDKLSMSKTYATNTTENITVSDLVGNTQTVSIIITNIDKEFNLPTVSYDITLPTSGNVIVTITAHEKMKNLGDWELSSDRLSMTKEYEGNINENITVEDLAGNTKTVNVTITNIDKSFNLPIVSYDKTEITNGDVIATITADEVMQEVAGWVLSSDKLSMSRKYTANVIENVIVKDIAGNEAVVNVTITNIDKEFNLPTVSYSTTLLTNGDVIATITADEAMQELTGWTIAEDKLSMSKTYLTNITEDITVKDIAGNEAVVNVTITNIDKEFNLPTVSYDITLPTSGNVIVTITADEKMKNLGDWELSSDRLSMTKEYEGNINENITVEDLAGNTKTVNVTITNIDKEGPILSYDTNIKTITNNDVVVTITANEKIAELTGWILAVDKMSLTKTYSENITENVTVNDILGNSSSIEIKIENIDKEAPIVTGVEDNKIYNENRTIQFNEGTATLNSQPFISDSEVSLEGNYQLIVTDIANNQTVINFIIDKTAPVISVDDGQTVHTNNFEITLENNISATFTPYQATALDNVSGNVDVNSTNNVDLSKEGSYKLTYTAKDIAGNETTLEVTVIVKDTVKPTVNSEIITTISTNNWYNKAIEIQVSGTDNGSGIKEYQYKKIINDVEDTEWSTIKIEDDKAIFKIENNSDNIKYKVRTIDNSGNTSDELVSSVYKLDTIKPVANLTITEEQTGSNSHKEPITLNITGSDNLSGISNYQYSYSLDNGTTWSKWTNAVLKDGVAQAIISDESKEIKIRARVRDIAGNYSPNKTSNTYTYDKTAPVITVSEEKNGGKIEHTGDFEVIVEANKDGEFKLYESSVTDNFTSDIKATVTGEVDLTKQGDYTLTYTAIDEALNKTELNVKVHVRDTTAPQLTVIEKNGDDSVEHDKNFVIMKEVDKTATFVNPEYKVSDNLAKDITVTITGNVDLSKIGNYNLTYTATDDYANTTVINVQVIVVDTTAPVITVIENKDGKEIKHSDDFKITREASKQDNYTNLVASAIDNYNEDITVNLVGNVDLSNVGSYQVTYTATDLSGNTSSLILTVQVVDTTAPVITVKEEKDGQIINHNNDFEITLETSKTATFTNLMAEATDNHDTNLDIATSGEVDLSKTGSYPVTYTVTDQAGNKSVIILTAKVVDTKAPIITLTGANPQSVKLGKTYDELGAIAIDEYDGELDVTIKGTVNINQLGNYEITYTATDSSNNKTTLTRTVKVEPISASEVYRTSNSCKDTGDCYNTKADNNYVWYSGHLWRVIKVNSNNTVKMIMEDSAAGFSYDDDSVNYVGSFAQDWLNNIFYPSLKNASTTLVTSEYCAQPQYSTTDISYTCNSSYIVNAKIGLLTIDEYNIIGGESSYLNNGDRYFTMTPGTEKSLWRVDYTGGTNAKTAVFAPYAIRPVITVSSSMTFTTGKGTKDSPYKFYNETSVNSGLALTSASSGEYVKFADQLWRIVTTGSYTKLVLDSPLSIDGSIVRQKYGTTNKFNTTDGIGNYLNTTVYNELFSADEKSKMTNLVLYANDYLLATNPRTAFTANPSNAVTVKVGLNSVGSLMSGSSSTGRVKDFTTWLINYNSAKNSAWHQSSVGANEISDYTTNERGIRPIIGLNTNVKITLGSGTSSDPYIVN